MLSHGRFLFFEYLSLSVFVYYGVFSITITPNMPVRSQRQSYYVERYVRVIVCFDPHSNIAFVSQSSEGVLVQ